jgi:tetratricopeptide (TPR) repeat protein
MKNTRLPSLMVSFAVALSSLTSLASPSSLVITDWSKDLQAAVTAKNSAQVRKLTDLNSLDASLFKRQNTIAAKALSEGRKFYAAGNMEKAIAAYEQVPRGSDAWLQSLDEKGWAYFRQGKMDKALGETRTLLGDTFVSIVGSDAFFLQSLSNLKICDYKSIFETGKLFKTTQKDRLLEIQNLSERGQSSAFTNVIVKANTFPLQFKEMGQEAKYLPSDFYRDVTLQKALFHLKLAEAGLPVLQQAQSSSAAIISAMNNLEKAKQGALLQAQNRIVILARAENEINFKNLQKLNLIEVEAIERMHADAHADKEKYAHGQFAETTSDDLIFPDEGDPWIDELGKYQVRVNLCPQNVRRQM